MKNHVTPLDTVRGQDAASRTGGRWFRERTSTVRSMPPAAMFFNYLLTEVFLRNVCYNIFFFSVPSLILSQSCIPNSKYLMFFFLYLHLVVQQPHFLRHLISETLRTFYHSITLPTYYRNEYHQIPFVSYKFICESLWCLLLSNLSVTQTTWIRRVIADLICVSY